MTITIRPTTNNPRPLIVPGGVYGWHATRQDGSVVDTNTLGKQSKQSRAIDSTFLDMSFTSLRLSHVLSGGYDAAINAISDLFWTAPHMLALDCVPNAWAAVPSDGERSGPISEMLGWAFWRSYVSSVIVAADLPAGTIFEPMNGPDTYWYDWQTVEGKEKYRQYWFFTQMGIEDAEVIRGRQYRIAGPSISKVRWTEGDWLDFSDRIAKRLIRCDVITYAHYPNSFGEGVPDVTVAKFQDTVTAHRDKFFPGKPIIIRECNFDPSGNSPLYKSGESAIWLLQTVAGIREGFAEEWYVTGAYSQPHASSIVGLMGLYDLGTMEPTPQGQAMLALRQMGKMQYDIEAEGDDTNAIWGWHDGQGKAIMCNTSANPVDISLTMGEVETLAPYSFSIWENDDYDVEDWK